MLERVWRKGNLQPYLECKLIQSLWKTVWRFLKKLGIRPPYDPEIPLLGIYPEETKIERDTCIPLFIAALFTIARIWKQPTARRSNQSIPNGINPEYSLEGQMLKLKLQYFGDLMQRDNSVEKSLILEKTEGKRRRGQWRIR